MTLYVCANCRAILFQWIVREHTIAYFSTVNMTDSTGKLHYLPWSWEESSPIEKTVLCPRSEDHEVAPFDVNEDELKILKVVAEKKPYLPIE